VVDIVLNMLLAPPTAGGEGLLQQVDDFVPRGSLFGSISTLKRVQQESTLHHLASRPNIAIAPQPDCE